MILAAHINPADWYNPNRWAVYQHSSVAGALLWIGYCRAPDVLQAPDARDSADWVAQVGTAPALALHVLSLHDTGSQAMREAMRLIRLHRPPANLSGGVRAPGNQRRVECVDTGAIYDSAAEACRIHGIHKSQMSVYLQRRDGRKIRGLTFRYV